mgnify:FL=1
MEGKNLRILITGNGGFVGKETTRVLLEAGHSVIGYDIMQGCDIRNAQQLEQVIQETKPDRILHLAAIARFSDADKDPKLAFETNALGTRIVAFAAAKFQVPLVYASTGSVYMPIHREPPITEDFDVKGNSVYGCSKAVGEKYVQTAGCPWIILRYAHLYGKEKRHHGLIGGFLERIERGLAPTLYGGKQSNDFTYIKDVARANLMACTASWDAWNQAYNVGTGEEITAEQAGKIVCELTGYKGEVEIKKGREVDPQRFVYDVRKAEQYLGFKSEYDFKQGLTDMFSVPFKI